MRCERVALEASWNLLVGVTEAESATWSCSPSRTLACPDNVPAVKDIAAIGIATVPLP